MARKYNLISELYDRTCKTVVANPQNWQNFLQSACRNYKLRYDEQLLIYAQRPDATAVLEIKRWNRNFGRWVNRGARGIAVFADEDRKTQRLSHYFDISDTHEGRYSRPVPLWDMQEEYTEAVIETLENTFGQLTYKSVLSDAVMSAAQNAAEDNLPDYLQDLLYVADNSFLAGLDEGMITTIYKKLVTNSVAYMMMARLGINVGEYFEAEDFRDVTNFNTQETLNALGFATSDIAEMGLSEISKTIRALSRNNRIIEADRKYEYNRDENTTERSGKNERDHIHDGRGLQPSESDLARTAGAGGGQMVTDEENISQGTAQSPVLQSPDERNPDKAFVGSTAEGERTGGNTGAGDGSQRGTDRTDESGRHDELGSADEQHQELGSGDRESTGHLRLEYYDRSHEDKSLPFFGSDKDINEILRTTSHLSASLEEIKDFYERTLDNAERTEFIKSIFNHDYTELALEDGRTVGYKTFQNVLHLWEGHYESRTKQSYYDWGVIARHFEAMRLLGELNDRIKPLPSMDGQLSFILDGQAGAEKTSAFSFSQEIIDTVLTHGSGISNGKMRIYEQFEKSLSAKENVTFLKNEYGWGGSAPVIIGTGINEQHDGKGITLARGFGNDAPKITLKWTQVEKRIGELIRMDRYLNPKEKEYYPKWLEEQEARRAELEEKRKNRQILSTAPKETPEQIAEEVSSEHYEYHLGDTVYIGASEYEILSFDDERVMLYDTEMPLFNKEFSRTEFDEKVRENPMNDHLKVPDQNAKPLEMLAQAKEIINEFCQNEYGSNADFSNLQEVGVAFTTITDDEIPIQVNANLVDFSIDQYLDGKLIESTKYRSMEEMIESALVYLDFDDLTSITDEQLENVLEVKTDKEPEPIKPQWEKKRSKVRSFDLHPDIPLAERNTFDLRNHPVEPAGKKERFRRNMEAIRVLKECEAENRFATPAEQIILSKYVGWGGLSEAFDERNSAWADEFLELRRALSPDEYAAARESTLTAFYTPPEVTTAIYKAMEQMGFKEGNLLEPSCGIGNFIGMLPESMANTRIYGVELDTISAGIAQQLYQKSSIAAQGFEEVNVPDSFFDGVVGNVPFGDFKVLDKRYDKYNFLIHDYFFAKSLDKLRPGGVMALVTSIE